MALLDSPWKNLLLGLASVNNQNAVGNVVDMQRRQREEARQRELDEMERKRQEQIDKQNQEKFGAWQGEQKSRKNFLGMLGTPEQEKDFTLSLLGRKGSDWKGSLLAEGLGAGYDPKDVGSVINPSIGSKYAVTSGYGTNPKTNKPDAYTTDETGNVRWLNTGTKVDNPRYQYLAGDNGYYAANVANPRDVIPVTTRGPSVATQSIGRETAVKPRPSRSSILGELPTQALKLQMEELDDIRIGNQNIQMLRPYRERLEKGDINLGLVGNLESKARNYVGFSNQQSRDYGSLVADLEKMRNDSLRLNKGAQTEGDATRAWNEIANNINDRKFVSERLKAIEIYNQRAIEERKNRVNTIRGNYGLGPFDFGGGSALAGTPIEGRAAPGKFGSLSNDEFLKLRPR